MNKCPSCSRDISDAARACPSCGASLENLNAPTRLFGDASTDETIKDGGTDVRSSPASISRASQSSSLDSIDGGSFVAGTILNERYRVVGLLGRGGMGEVYRADDLTLGQAVALKFLPASLLADGATLARFHREVRVARQVSHRNVCRVYDIGEAAGRPFLSMEFIKGEELASLLHRIGRLPHTKAAQIARQICAGLSAAHEAGVLHRDLKPANVMIDADGNARITDFGLAGVVEDFQADESLIGTPAYMSPEQLAGKELTIRSDIYSLGLVLYELFTGRRAFDAPTLHDLIRLRRSDASPASVTSIVRDVDPTVERVIERCLEKDPERRPASAAQVAASLPGGDPLAAALAAGETPSPEMVAAAPTEGRLRPPVAIALFAAALIGLALCVWLNGRAQLVQQLTLDKSPEVLRERAREIVRSFGHDRAPLDSASGFYAGYRDYVEYIKEHDSSPTRWQHLTDNRPATLRFWYRSSPHYFDPNRRGFQQGVVTSNTPQTTEPGMDSIALDPNGRLLLYERVSPEYDESPPAPPPDWRIAFDAAGFDINQFRETGPRWNGGHTSDARAAWEGVYPEQPEIPLRIEAAAYRGKIVYFALINPWTRPAEQQSSRQMAAGEIILTAIFTTALIIILLVGMLLARRNVRLGRADRKGAFRLALFFFILLTLPWLLRAHFVPSVNQLVDMFLDYLFLALGFAGVIWMVYVALEPFVRGRSPHRIIAWNRLLAGQVRDPLVGRDVLVGALAGLASSLVLFAWRFSPQWFGLPPTEPVNRSWANESLSGIRHTLAEIVAHGIFDPILMAMVVLFMLLLFTLIFRKERLAIFACWFLLALVMFVSGEHPAFDWVFALALASLFVFTLVRFGLLAMAVLLLFVGVPEMPLTFDFSAWYAPSSIITLVFLVALIVYGFYTSLGGQKLVREGFLGD